MQITSSNFHETIAMGSLEKFYRATQSGVEECNLLYREDGVISGFHTGPNYVKVHPAGPNGYLTYIPQGGEYFTSEGEAIQSHRNAVLANLAQLNSTSLRSAPILYGNPIN